MKKTILALSLFIPLISNAGDVDGKIISILKANRLNSAKASISAMELHSGKELAKLNAELALNPASCTKLITTAVALKKLGADYKFPTEFYLDKGNLYVKGYGDPSFVIERMEEAVRSLIKTGIPVEINDIIIDDTFFDEPGFPGRQKRSTRSYNALTSAVALNHSAATVEVFPAEKIGEPAIVKVDAPGIFIINKAKTGAPKTKKRIYISRIFTKEGDTVKISGSIPLGGSPRKQFFNIAEPAQHFAEALVGVLNANGIAVSGNFKYGTVPANAKIFFTAKSPPLFEMIKSMNKHSNNFMAEQLVKTLGAKEFGSPGETLKGMDVIHKYLASIGVTNYFLENGSGLSYKNKIGSHELLKVMADIYNDKGLREHYIDSLSIYGVDGTMKKWESPLFLGKLKAKTGTLNGVVTLAGFMPKGHDMVAFVIMLNGGHVSPHAGRKAEEEIVEAFIE